MQTLGIDLGGTFARAAVVNAEGEILASAKTALSDRRPEAVIEAIAHAADGALASAGGVEVTGCGVGVAGQLAEGGRVIVAPNLGWRDVPFGALLSARLGRAVRVLNDLAAAGWGELCAGAGKGARDLFVVFVGSGVGSTTIANGRLVRGSTGVAGEFGHIKVVIDGRRCGCGERGCLEAYAGGHNLIAQMKEALQAGKPTELLRSCGGDATKLTPALLELESDGGDVVAQSIYLPAIGYLSLAIANQVTFLNPARVILGGGVLNHAPGMRRRIRDAIAQYTSVTSRAAVAVVEAALGDDSGLIGAGLLASQSELG